MKPRSIYRGDLWCMGWPVLAYFIRPLLLYVRRPQPRDSRGDVPADKPEKPASVSGGAD